MKNPIPCVGFALQYSPLQRKSVENFAHFLHSKIQKFKFDVIEAVEIGQNILMLFSNAYSAEGSNTCRGNQLCTVL